MRGLIWLVLLLSLIMVGCSQKLDRVVAPSTSAGSVVAPGTQHAMRGPASPLSLPKPVKKPGAKSRTVYEIDDNGNVYPATGGSGGYHWSGGATTVPFGDGISPQYMITVARNMALVQYAVIRMETFGFIRRPDLDGAINADTAGVVIIGFEQPGFDPTVKQPCVIIHSRAVGNGAITQASGAVYVMNSDSTLGIDTTTVSPFILAGTSSTSSASKDSIIGPDYKIPLNDLIGMFFDAAIDPTSPWTAFTFIVASTDPCVQQAYASYVEYVLPYACGYGCIAGAGSKTWWGGALGFLGGELIAARDWYFKYKDGFPC